MKKILIASMAAAMLVACSNDSIVDQSQESIGFGSTFVNNSTRAFDPSFNNAKMFADFAVYGFITGENNNTAPLFDGVKVTGSGTGNNASWSYGAVQYWVPGAKYNFCAVAPMTNGGWTKSNCAVANNVISTNLQFTNNGTTDLLYAEHEQVEGLISGNSKVDFTFRHLLSKVRFTFTNGYNATGATIQVRNIHITDAYTKADVALSSTNTTWSDAEDATLDLNFGNANVLVATNGITDAADANTIVALSYSQVARSFNELLVIPAEGPVTTKNGNSYTITFDVDILINGVLVKTYTHEASVALNPAPGHSYNLTTTINGENINPDGELEPIEFTVNDLPGWTNPEAELPF